MKTSGSNRTKWFSLLLSMALFTNCADQASSQVGRDNSTGTVKPRKIQIALLLDTSNSMDGLIDQAKSQLWTIVSELAKAKCDNLRPVLQIALYEYGNNSLPASEGFIRMVTPLTSDLDKISQDLFGLTTNGGDEFCGEVIKTCLQQLDWSSSKEDLQLIFIAGNEPFTQGSASYKNACTNAKEKKVVVNTIFCGNFDEGISGSWRNGAELAGGSYSSIEQNRKTVYIESPYDKRIIELNNSLNNTYVPYGAKGREKKENQKMQDQNASTYSEVNSVKRAVSKSSAVYKNEEWDLVDAAQTGGVDIAEMEEKALPSEMQNMDDAQRTIYIKQKAEERQKISKEIQELDAKRASYVAALPVAESGAEMLDKAMISAIRKQASALNFVIEQ